MDPDGFGSGPNMKYRITPQQLNQLPGDRKPELRSWLEKHGYSGWDVSSLLLSVVQMMEFLQTYKMSSFGGIISVGIELHPSPRSSKVTLTISDDGEDEEEELDFRQDEVCDALWQAVQHVLRSRQNRQATDLLPS
jgi:hypothetical protein